MITAQITKAFLKEKKLHCRLEVDGPAFVSFLCAGPVSSATPFWGLFSSVPAGLLPISPSSSSVSTIHMLPACRGSARGQASASSSLPMSSLRPAPYGGATALMWYPPNPSALDGSASLLCFRVLTCFAFWFLRRGAATAADVCAAAGAARCTVPPRRWFRRSSGASPLGALCVVRCGGGLEAVLSLSSVLVQEFWAHGRN